MRLRTLAVTLLAATATGGVLTPVAHAAVNGDRLLVFARTLNSSAAPYSNGVSVLDLDTSEVRQVIPSMSSPGHALTDPMVSPDGQWAAYAESTSEAGACGAPQAVSLTQASTSLTPLTCVPDAQHPAWTPDGAYLIVDRPSHYDAAAGMMLHDLWQVPVNGGPASPLAGGTDAIEPRVSPDGRFVSFVDEDSTFGANGALSLAVMNIDGTGRHDLPENADCAVWAPDMSKLAMRYGINHGSQIAVSDADGTNLTVLPSQAPQTSTPGAGCPTWSSDGSTIYFAQQPADLSGDTDLWSINADGTGLTDVLSDTGNSDSSPTFWGPSEPRAMTAAPPTGLSATPGPSSARLSWQPSTITGVTGYRVTMQPGNVVTTVTDPAATGTTISGLTDGTTFSFSVNTLDGLGAGLGSAPVSATPVERVSAPANVTATAHDSLATVNWSAATAPDPSDPGAAVQSYLVTASPNGPSATVSGTATTVDVPGLTNGNDYTFTVTASNAAGLGAASAPSNPVIPFGPPTAPMNVTATAADRAATISWTAASPNGAPITGYRINTSPPGPTVIAAANSTMQTVSGLTNGTHYSFTVTASNAAGDGPASAPTGTVTPADRTSPSVKITTPTAVAVASTDARIAWRGTDTGVGIASYDVRFRSAAYSGGFGAWRYPSAWQRTSSTSLVHALVAGYDYCFAVRARDNAGNMSPWTERCVTRPLDDRALNPSAGWSTGSGSAFYMHSYRRARGTGLQLSRSGADVDRVGVVATTCPTCGKIAIYAGSILLGRINLFSATTHFRRIILLPRFTLRWTTIKIKTLNGQRVDIDGLVASRT